MSSAVSRLIESIRGRVAFVAAQAGAGIGRDALQESQVQAICTSIAETAGKLTVDEGTVLTSEINGGPWTLPQKQRMATTICDTINKVGGATQARCQQTNEWLHNYFLEEDWQIFTNTEYSMDAKIRVMGGRMWLVGMSCPQEKVLEQGGAILVALNMDPDSTPAHEKMAICKKIQTTIKEMDKKNGKKHPFEHRRRFPPNPRTELPAQLLIY
eukprot:9494103-Pyramimonas_sp.AAC.1